jgi:hypothetical protein
VKALTHIVVVSLSSLVAACGGTVMSVEADVGAPDGGADGEVGLVSDIGAGDAVADPFCTGTEARLSINGADAPVLNLYPKTMPLNCCDAGVLGIATGAFQSMMFVSWRVQVGPVSLPATFDLASLPPGVTFGLYLGCDPATASCTSAPDHYSELRGTVQIARTAQGGYDVTYCVTAAEPAGAPHPILHEVHFYAPNILHAN